MLNYNKLYQQRKMDELKEDKVIQMLFSRIEKEHNAKIQRIARHAMDGKEFYMTLIMEDYALLEVCLSTSAINLGDMVGLEVSVEAY